jgi:hypothetical protein
MTTSLRVTWATWVSQSAPTSNYFKKTGYLSVSNQSSHVKFAYLWFANPFPRTGANVLSAKLTLRTRKVTGSGTVNLGVDLATPYPVGIGLMNWNTRASAAGHKVQLTKSAPLAENAAWTFDVTDMMQTVGSGYGFNGFILSTTNTRDINVQGNMSAALDPVLEVEWTEAPLPPDQLAPSTGQATGVALPVLRWSFWDHAGATGMQSAQVQVASSEDGFGSPLWDSGSLPLTETQLDLAATSCPAPAVDTLRWWRVRNQDSAGLWSAWSDPVSWQWHPRLSVSLVQPDGATFSDPTPVIQWATSGDMPQSRWRASVSILDGSAWRVVASSGTVVSAETSWTPDVGLANAGTARIIVDVWDDRAREATPGVPIYASASGEFAFSPSDTIEIPKNIQLIDLAPMPSVTLRFTRSEVPDRWDIYRDDMLLTRHSGLDFLVEGDQYEVTDQTAPNGPHTWTIFAIVNGVAAKSQAVTATIAHPGTWLCDPDTGDKVCIVGGNKDLELSLPEDRTTFTPIGSKARVDIIAAQRGYEATCKGSLVGNPATGATAEQQRDMLRRWREDVGHRFILLVSDMALPVNINNVQTWRTVQATGPRFDGDPGHVVHVSFDWHQIDWFDVGSAS